MFKLKFFQKYINISDLVDSKFRVSFFILVLLILVSTIFETLSLGLFIPVINTIFDPEFLNEISKKLNINFINSISKEYYFIVVLGLLLICYFLKFIYLIFFNIYKNTLLFKFNAFISNKLLEIYISNNYSFFLEHNKSKLLRNIITETSSFTSRAINARIQLLADILLIIFFLIFLIFIEPIATILVFLFFISVSTVFYINAKKKLKNWGEERFRHEGLKFQFIEEIFNGIKEIKIFNNELFFLTKFVKSNNKTNLYSKNEAILGSLPRIGLELLSMVSFALLCTIMFFQEKEIKHIIIVLGIFAISAFRLLPCVNSILSSLQKIKFGEISIKTLMKEFKLNLQSNIKSLNKKKYKLKSKIEFKNVSFKYNKSSKFSISNLNFVIKKNEIKGIFGKSGAGKSTTLDLLAGLIIPTKGEILVDKININTLDKEWINSISYVSQSIFLLNDTIKNNIALGSEKEKIDSSLLNICIKQSNLSDLINRLNQGIETIIGGEGIRLSGGEIQRLGIARALYKKSDILILDEATSALDFENEQIFLNTIKKLKKEKTIIIVSHKKSSLDICDEVIEIKS